MAAAVDSDQHSKLTRACQSEDLLQSNVRKSAHSWSGVSGVGDPNVKIVLV